MWYAIGAYFKYILKRKRAAHSAFVYKFITQVLQNKETNTLWTEIEKRRNYLSHNQKTICVLDLGAKGQGQNRVSIRKIASIVKTSSKSAKIYRVLSRIVQFYNLENIVEFGTSFGLSTAYIATANATSKVFTVEGCPEISKIASETFKELKLNNIEQINVDFDYAIKHFADKFHNLDFFFVDGNHDYVPTINYFNFAKQYAKENTIFVFDDIYWSKSMTKAWQTIKADPQVTITIDLYYIGIVFFRKGIVKQDFILKI